MKRISEYTQQELAELMTERCDEAVKSLLTELIAAEVADKLYPEIEDYDY